MHESGRVLIRQKQTLFYIAIELALVNDTLKIKLSFSCKIVTL